MQAAIGEKGTRYTVQCYNCRQSYDAAEAVWCNCLSTVRSFICPHCFNCFCAAPNSYKDKFWESAPQELWNRMIEEHHKRPETQTFKADELKHPLVLIVEPDKQIQSMAKRIVEQFGYSAVVADDGFEGLAMAQEHLPDLVLTAALMPKMDGREMCRMIKQSASTANTKVAVMTELYTKKKYRSEAFKKFSVDEYITKPVRMQELQSILQKYLDVRSPVG
jgi:CheY-like chemotaxis protein